MLIDIKAIAEEVLAEFDKQTLNPYVFSMAKVFNHVQILTRHILIEQPATPPQCEACLLGVGPDRCRCICSPHVVPDMAAEQVQNIFKTSSGLNLSAIAPDKDGLIAAVEGLKNPDYLPPEYRLVFNGAIGEVLSVIRQHTTAHQVKLKAVREALESLERTSGLAAMSNDPARVNARKALATLDSLIEQGGE